MKSSLLWRPFTSLEESRKPLVVERAEGLYLYTTDGRRIADMNASWWVNIHGHSHPHIIKAVLNQLNKFDHVMFSNCTHEAAEQFSEKIINFIPTSHRRIFISDNGSTSVEVALKMALQYHYLHGHPRKRFLALHGGYHGDTFGGMSVAERNLFNRPFGSLLFDVYLLELPSDENIHLLIKKIEYEHEKEAFAGFIYEPQVQGASGMRMYPSGPMNILLQKCRELGIITITDEVMTGLGRTGTFLASEIYTVSPDLICLSKGLTGGIFPMGVTTVSEKIAEVFQSNSPIATFYHGHSYTAYAAACAAATANLEIFEKEPVLQNVAQIEHWYEEIRKDLIHNPHIRNFRVKGVIAAAEIMLSENDHSDYLNPLKGKIYDFFLEHNILIRPLGNTFYLLPPYCVKRDEILYAFSILNEFLKKK